MPAAAAAELAAGLAGRPLSAYPGLLAGNLAFPGRGCILEAIMLITGQNIRYVA
jgi:hypothetical protein